MLPTSTPTVPWGVCPSVQAYEGICKSLGVKSRVRICPSQSHRTLIYVLDLHGWNSKASLCCTSAGLVEEQEKLRYVKGWWRCALPQPAPLLKEHGTWEALWKNAVHSCLSKQPLCISSVSHTAWLSVPTLHVIWEKSMVVLHVQEGTPWSRICLGDEPPASPGKSVHAGFSL